MSRCLPHERPASELRVAFVHYWLTGMAGGEKVLEALCRMFPQADIYTHVLDRASISETLAAHRIETTFIDRIPGARRHYQLLLPLMPLALEQLDLSDYDLVVSSESGPAKGVITGPDTLHLCYCHSPMRYAWDLYHEYRAGRSFPVRALMTPIMHYIRQVDRGSAAGVDRFIANSGFVARRIRKFYRRDADVIHPPADVQRFELSTSDDGYYLVLGRLIGYKRVDLAIEAVRGSERQLVILGGGEELEALRRDAPENVRFLGAAPDGELEATLSACRALVFPGLEDFGIVPVEAMACGKPVICYGRGGVLDSVPDGDAGVHFHEQTPQALRDALDRFEREGVRWSAERIRAHARSFAEPQFTAAMGDVISDGFEALFASGSSRTFAEVRTTD